MDARRRAKILVSTACAAGAVLVMAGCSGSDPIVTETPVPNTSESAELQPSATPSVSVSVSPSVTVLSDEELLEILPAGAELPNVEGAVVTAQFFIQEFSRLFTSGETAIWDALSMPQCTFCATSRDAALGYQDKGWLVVGGEFEQGEGVTEANLQGDKSVIVKYPTVRGPVLVTEPGESQRIAQEETTATQYVHMELVGSVWRVREVGLEPA